MSDAIIKFDHIYKEYRLGTIGGGTLKGDLQSLVAKIRGKEDPNTIIGTQQKKINYTDKFLALDDVSFNINPGETVGIIGRNGAGKSTLLKLLSRVTVPTKGKIYVNGRIASMLEVGTGFHPELTGRENIYLNGAILGMTKAEITRKFDEIVAFSEIEKFIDTPVKRYSSGMYVKLAFSVAAHLDSEILVMDEVLAVGDAKFQEKCLGKMGDVAENDGRTVLYVSHNMGTIRKLCSRCVVLQQGRVIYDGDVEKAIDIYMESHDVTSMSNDLTCTKRHGNPSLEAKLRQISIINRTNTNIFSGEKLECSLEWECTEKIKNLYIRCHIVYADGTSVGIAYADPLEVHSGMYRKTISIDTSCLAPGKYYCTLILYNRNTYGVEERYDCIDNAIGFEVFQQKDNSEFSQWTNGWGHIILPRLKIVDP